MCNKELRFAEAELAKGGQCDRLLLFRKIEKWTQHKTDMVGVEGITIPKQKDDEADTVITGKEEMNVIIGKHFKEQFEKADVDLEHYLVKDFNVSLEGVFELD